MKKNKYIAPRGDNFYYIEVWDKQSIRDQKISDILDLSQMTKPKYLNGSSTTQILSDSIEFALFWKTRESAEYRIESFKRRGPSFIGDKIYIIRFLDRDDFISKIPDNCAVKAKQSEKIRLVINQELKKKEITYKKKIENVWLERTS